MFLVRDARPHASVTFHRRRMQCFCQETGVTTADYELPADPKVQKHATDILIKMLEQEEAELQNLLEEQSRNSSPSLEKRIESSRRRANQVRVKIQQDVMEGPFQNIEQLKSQVLTDIVNQQEDIRGLLSELQQQVLQDHSVVEDLVKKRQVVDKQVVALREILLNCCTCSSCCLNFCSFSSISNILNFWSFSSCIHGLNC
ncbi:hypothetical protein DPX16_10531 [Anabarilius grahami]|uniref:Uncharacterized protein n=1 Tax=Anabarilius grahami TaxID=495550 RepID=A0A3N0Z832_ANAGA|nr:hypothetical protein DPX16_10531 [Anabarilius grahami]